MESEDALELIEEYNRWVSEKKISGVDTSPQAFIVDRAKEQALSTLIAIQEESENFDHENEAELVGYARWVIGVINDI